MSVKSNVLNITVFQLLTLSLPGGNTYPADTPFNVNLLVVDSSGSPVAGFTGAKLLVDGASSTAFPATSAAGTSVLTVTLSAPGTHTLEASSTFPAASSNTLSVGITQAVATALSVSVLSTSVSVGTPFAVTLMVTDALGNPVSRYSGAALYVDNVKSLTFPATNSSGLATVTETLSTSGNHSLEARSSSLSSNLVTVDALGGVISASATPTSGVTPLTSTFSGTELDQSGSPVVGRVLSIFIGTAKQTQTVTTGAGGAFSIAITFSTKGTFVVFFSDALAGVRSNGVTVSAT